MFTVLQTRKTRQEVSQRQQGLRPHCGKVRQLLNSHSTWRTRINHILTQKLESHTYSPPVSHYYSSHVAEVRLGST